MAKETVESIIKSSIVMAFSIAAALIWKDVIMDLIEIFVPAREEIFYKLLAAVLATILVIIAIYIFLKTESEAEIIMKSLNKKK